MHSVVNKSTAPGLPTLHGNANNLVTLPRAAQARPRRLSVEPHLVLVIRLPTTPALAPMIPLPISALVQLIRLSKNPALVRLALV